MSITTYRTVKGYVDPSTNGPATDCSVHHAWGYVQPGVYSVARPADPTEEVEVRCHDGWTVVLARGQEHKVDFGAKTFEEYKDGFGSPYAGEYFMGLDLLAE